MRIFNPSATQDITVNAVFLPIGKSIERSPLLHAGRSHDSELQMAVYDDAVASIFSESGLGAIYFYCPDPFFTTARIYADTASCTLGQDFTGTSIGNLMYQGVLLQLQLRATSLFRTNIGAVNLQNRTTTVTWTIYDRNNNAVGSSTTEMPAYAVIGPTSITSGFFGTAGNADLTDAWVGFSANAPVDAYASIIDNLPSDPTFLPAQNTAP